MMEAIGNFMERIESATTLDELVEIETDIKIIEHKVRERIVEMVLKEKAE